MHQSRPAEERDRLTVPEAVEFHFRNTPRKRPLHRSAMYRLLKSGRIDGEVRGGTVYVNAESLAHYCAGRPASEAAAPRPSEVARSEAALQRIRDRHRVGGDRGEVSS